MTVGLARNERGAVAARRVLLLVFGDLVSADGTIAASHIFDRLVQRSFWLASRIPKPVALAPFPAIFYRSGDGFVATANVVQIEPASMSDIGVLGRANPVHFAYKLRLEDTRIFQNPIPMAPLVNELSFVSNKKYWGHALRTSPRWVDNRDLETILAAEGKCRTR